MKYLVKFFVVTFFFIISTHTFAEQKIVVLDMKYVLNKSKAGKGAQDFLKKSFNNNAKKYSDMEKALKKEESDLLEKKNILSKVEYTKKSDALRKNVIDYNHKEELHLIKLQLKELSQKKLSYKKYNRLWMRT